MSGVFLRALLAIWFSIGIGSYVSAQEAERPALKFFSGVPEGWRSEVLPFPLSFAPSLDYQGVEELMFAPGMFKSDAPDFFAYAFLWIVDGNALPTAEKLKADLDLYYHGLQKAVHAPATQAVNVRLEPHKSESPDVVRYKGSVDWIEPFETKAAQTLVFDAEFWRCEGSEQWGAYFVVVPEGAGADVIKALNELSYRRCE